MPEWRKIKFKRKRSKPSRSSTSGMQSGEDLGVSGANVLGARHTARAEDGEDHHTRLVHVKRTHTRHEKEQVESASMQSASNVLGARHTARAEDGEDHQTRPVHVKRTKSRHEEGQAESASKQSARASKVAIESRPQLQRTKE